MDKETGKCKFEDYFLDVIMKFFVYVIPGLLVSVLLVGLYYYIKDNRRKKLYPLEHELAIVLARIHQTSQTKTLRDNKPVFVGVGKNPENLAEWVNEIWNMYVLDVKYPGMSGQHFENFVKGSFRIVQSKSQFDSSVINKLISKRFSLKSGRITKK